MATVVLQTVGAAVGGAIAGPFGALLGRAAGAAAGYAIDQTYLSKDHVVQGARLDSSRILSSQEGAPVPKIYGRNRLSGQVIWATRFEEVASTQKSGGKGTGPKSTTTNFSYYANFAVGLCEGPIAGVRRIWADGQELDLTTIEYRFYSGADDQQPDPLIEAKQGLGNAPAYKGIAYIVFEGLPLESYGNRIPQLSFELLRVIGSLEEKIKSITVIPGSTEFGYDTKLISNGGGSETYQAHNRSCMIAETDWQASIDELQMVCPNLEKVALVVAWFGTDLRADECKIRPGVTTKVGSQWQVGDIRRHDAHLISSVKDKPAYGGTPDDNSVLRAIADLKSRGLKVVLYPFIMMDIPDGNTFTGLSGEIHQPSYPWRGEISCSPQPGADNTVDKSAVAREQLTFFSEQYRDFIRHYKNLCVSAGGVDGFLIGSEMRGLTRIRDEQGKFPFVQTLIELASECREALGPETIITYAADWSEYFGYQPQDDSGDVLFNLDSLWASDAINAIGIDNYMPLSDWRDEGDPDNPYASSPHSLEYLKSNILAGEGYEWYYRDQAERTLGSRTPVTDGYGTPWIYRYKDIRSWWSNFHYDRIGGVIQPEPSSWIPQSKPFFFTEVGCPAVDKGANQPNVFYDKKSDQSALPYFSSGGRDDLIQRRYLEAHFSFWEDEENNPYSEIDNRRMVDNSAITPWAWDSRPFPWFPLNTDRWSDGENWHLGHWLTGRLGGCSLQDLVVRILEEYGCKEFEVTLDGVLDGYAIPDQSSARAALEPLLELHDARVFEENGKIIIRHPVYAQKYQVNKHDLIQEDDDTLKVQKRGNELELPAEAIISHLSTFDEFEESKTKSRRLDGGSDRQINLQVPAVLSRPTALTLAESRLRKDWIGRDECSVAVSNEKLFLSAGDIVQFPDYSEKFWEIQNIERGERHQLSLRSIADFPKLSPQISATHSHEKSSSFFGRPDAVVMDLPLMRSSDQTRMFNHFALSASPWARNYALYSSPQTDGFELRANIHAQATIGNLIVPLQGTTLGRWDNKNEINLSLTYGKLESATEIALLNGANILAIETNLGSFELVQFTRAELQSDGNWKLSRLLRGQLGTELEMQSGAPIGAKVVLLNAAVLPLEVSDSEVGISQNWRIGPVNNGLNSEAFTTMEVSNNARSRKMFSPAHLKAELNEDSSLLFTWIRRGRLNSDSWDGSDIPLDADKERYILTISKPDGSIVRELIVAEPQYLYSSQMQTSDLGNASHDFLITVAQLSDTGVPGSQSSLKI